MKTFDAFKNQAIHTITDKPDKDITDRKSTVVIDDEETSKPEAITENEVTLNTKNPRIQNRQKNPVRRLTLRCKNLDNKFNIRV